MSNDTGKRGEDVSFSFATRELRAARVVAKPLQINAAHIKLLDDNPGCDPYNTSGSFDRRNNWTKVGKR
jgi:hypothetical protein